MSIPLRELPAELVREMRIHKRLVFFLFAVVTLGSLLLPLRENSSFSSHAVIVVDVTGSATESRDEAADGVERVAQAIDALGLHRLAVEATHLAGEDPDAEAVDLAVERVRRNVELVAGENGRVILGYRDDSPEAAFNVLQFISHALTSASPSGSDAQTLPASVSGSAPGRVPYDRAEAGRAAVEDLDQRIADRRERIRQLEPREARARETAPADLLAVTRERTTELQAAIGEVDRQRETLLQRRQEMGDAARDSAASLTLGAQIDALSEKKRGLAVTLANTLAQLEKLESFESEAAALAVALDKDRKALFDLLARREALLGAARGEDAPGAGGDSSRSVQAITDQGMTGLADIHGLVLSEAATSPVVTAAFTPRHLLMVGLLAGVLTPVLLLSLFCLVDPRVRSSTRLEARAGVPVLMDIPTIPSPLDQRREASRLLWLCVMALLVVVVHGAVASVVWSGGAP